MGNSHDNRKQWPKMSFKMVLFLCLIFAAIICPAVATMEITAFEYKRKFHKMLNLGECCQREIAVNMGNNSYYIEAQKCSLYKKGSVTYIPQESSEFKNVLITSADMVVTHLGLCTGEAASFLGILNSGDCVAIEIASRLSFSDKTAIRASVGIYQTSLDTLESDSSILDGMEMYYEDKFYLKVRTYGTFEILLVQFRFDSVLAAQEAKMIKNPTHLMSQYMEQIQQQVGYPKNVMVISLSTATHETFQVELFQKPDWDRAVRYVQILELGIQRTKNQISSNAKNYHLIYRLNPFLENTDYRLTLPKYWEEISILEVQLRQAIKVAKSTVRKCRGNKSLLCRRVRQLKQKLTAEQVGIHKGRADWIRLKPEERLSLATHYGANVKSYTSITKTLAKSVKQMNNKEKKLSKADKTVNQIPRNPEEHILKRQRQMRQGRIRNKDRNGQSS
ncbi:unnamed protein product [Candidula unifasciata]|uniref:Uncharacterized protein n=1 Tax=Candidula unifasciata TaxID=100452 RepID=A0A8S3Z4W5_9EUPU|nr:unnamed protein product [Candidula unifasciata]